jgi:hypothetical protein
MTSAFRCYRTQPEWALEEIRFKELLPTCMTGRKILQRFVGDAAFDSIETFGQRRSRAACGRSVGYMASRSRMSRPANTATSMPIIMLTLLVGPVTSSLYKMAVAAGIPQKAAERTSSARGQLRSSAWGCKRERPEPSILSCAEHRLTTIHAQYLLTSPLKIMIGPIGSRKRDALAVPFAPDDFWLLTSCLDRFRSRSNGCRPCSRLPLSRKWWNLII